MFPWTGPRSRFHASKSTEAHAFPQPFPLLFSHTIPFSNHACRRYLFRQHVHISTCLHLFSPSLVASTFKKTGKFIRSSISGELAVVFPREMQSDLLLSPFASSVSLKFKAKHSAAPSIAFCAGTQVYSHSWHAHLWHLERHFSCI